MRCLTLAFPIAGRFLPRLWRHGAPVVAVALLACVSGCGLDVYERKLQAEQKRIHDFDEADQLLGNPVDFPLRLPTGPVPVNFPRNDNLFFRAPVVIAQKPDGIPVDDFLCRYARAPVAAGGPAVKSSAPRNLPRPALSGRLTPELERETGFREMFIALSTSGKSAEFTKRVLASCNITAKPRRQTVERFGLPAITYDVWSFTESDKPSSLYYLYVAHDGRATVALVYHVGKEKAANQALKNALLYSLQSLVLGDGAKLVYDRYLQRPPPKAKPAF
jgi:hypothetical protein